MSERSVTHASFTIKRTYDASVAQVFAAWADPTIKRRWFSGSDGPSPSHKLDFRVGGKEVNRSEPADGRPVHTYEARYRDIVPDERIVYTYDMYVDETRMSVSVATIEFAAAGDGTQLTMIEQGAYLDGLDTSAQREHGTGVLLKKLDAALVPERSIR